MEPSNKSAQQKPEGNLLSQPVPYVTIVCENQEFTVSKEIINKSKPLNSLFSSGFKESRTPKAKLHEVSSKAFEIVLQILHLEKNETTPNTQAFYENMASRFVDLGDISEILDVYTAADFLELPNIHKISFIAMKNFFRSLTPEDASSIKQDLLQANKAMNQDTIALQGTSPKPFDGIHPKHRAVILQSLLLKAYESDDRQGMASLLEDFEVNDTNLDLADLPHALIALIADIMVEKCSEPQKLLKSNNTLVPFELLKQAKVPLSFWIQPVCRLAGKAAASSNITLFKRLWAYFHPKSFVTKEALLLNHIPFFGLGSTEFKLENGMLQPNFICPIETRIKFMICCIYISSHIQAKKFDVVPSMMRLMSALINTEFQCIPREKVQIPEDSELDPVVALEVNKPVFTPEELKLYKDELGLDDASHPTRTLSRWDQTLAATTNTILALRKLKKSPKKSKAVAPELVQSNPDKTILLKWFKSICVNLLTTSFDELHKQGKLAPLIEFASILSESDLSLSTKASFSEIIAIYDYEFARKNLKEINLSGKSIKGYWLPKLGALAKVFPNVTIFSYLLKDLQDRIKNEELGLKTATSIISLLQANDTNVSVVLRNFTSKNSKKDFIKLLCTELINIDQVTLGIPLMKIFGKKMKMFILENLVDGLIAKENGEGALKIVEESSKLFEDLNEESLVFVLGKVCNFLLNQKRVDLVLPHVNKVLNHPASSEYGSFLAKLVSENVEGAVEFIDLTKDVQENTNNFLPALKVLATQKGAKGALQAIQKNKNTPKRYDQMILDLLQSSNTWRVEDLDAFFGIWSNGKRPQREVVGQYLYHLSLFYSRVGVIEKALLCLKGLEGKNLIGDSQNEAVLALHLAMLKQKDSRAESVLKDLILPLNFSTCKYVGIGNFLARIAMEGDAEEALALVNLAQLSGKKNEVIMFLIDEMVKNGHFDAALKLIDIKNPKLYWMSKIYEIEKKRLEHEIRLAMAKQNALEELSKKATAPSLDTSANIPEIEQESQPGDQQEPQPEPMQVATTTTEEQLRSRKRPLDEAGVPPLLPPTSAEGGEKEKKAKTSPT